MGDREKRGMGCFAKGCIVCLALVLVCGVVVVVKIGDWTRSFIAWGAEKGAEAMFEGVKLPADERERAMQVIREFTQDIVEDKVSNDQVGQVLQALLQGPVPVVIGMRMFENAYIQPSALDEAAKQAAHLNLSRFVHGVATEAIPRTKGDEIMAIVSEPDPENPGKTRIKPALKPEELGQCLAIMKDAADVAQIAMQEFPIDIAAEIRKAIDAGMKGQLSSAPVAPGSAPAAGTSEE